MAMAMVMVMVMAMAMAMAGKEEAKPLDGGSISEGKWYWMCAIQDGEEGRPRRRRRRRSLGVVVMVAWMLSKRKYHAPYIRLFNSLGWDCLVCQPHVLNLWFPHRANILARRILDELVKELHHRQRPIVFASFSGGSKACLYKLLQVIQGKFENARLTQKYEMVRACAAGQIFDSSPVDFKSTIGVKFVKAELKGSLVPDVALDIFVGGARTVLELFFHHIFEAQRLEFWETLNSSKEIGPILILCSRKDELAPFDGISKFCSRISDSGHEVTLMSWEDSDHVGHYRLHPLEYKAAVSKLLANAHANYVQRTEIPGPSHKNAPNSSSEPDVQLRSPISCQSSSSTSSSQATGTNEQSDRIDDISCGENGVFLDDAAKELLKRSRL